MLWYTKSRRAQNPDDYETWIEGGVMPTMNAFDNGDIRTTILITTANIVGTLQARDYKGVGNQYVAEDKLIIEEPIIAFDTQFGSNATTFEDLSPTLKASQQSPSVQGVPGMAVRRLTPVECERLQGFPDNWTEGQSDSARYKQMGNAVAVPVVEWIIGNICDTLKTAE